MFFTFSVYPKELQFNSQFTKGSEHMLLPSIVVYSVQVGSVNWEYLPFTLESIRLNPQVQFILINIMESPNNKYFKRFSRYTKKLSNFYLHIITPKIFDDTVYKKLGLKISVEINSKWFNMICDYKPILAYLFPEFLDNPEQMKLSIKKSPEFWGYVDIDVVWGNISRFSHLFHENTIISAGNL